MLAKTLERVVPRLLGLPLRVGSFYSFLHELGVGEKKEGRLRERVPTLHDLEVWGFEDMKCNVKDADVRELIEKSLAECEE